MYERKNEMSYRETELVNAVHDYVDSLSLDDLRSYALDQMTTIISHSDDETIDAFLNQMEIEHG